jgi:hypothetical protein
MHIAKKKVGNEFVGRHTFYIRDPSCPSYCEITVHAIVMTVPFFLRKDYWIEQLKPLCWTFVIYGMAYTSSVLLWSSGITSWPGLSYSSSCSILAWSRKNQKIKLNFRYTFFLGLQLIFKGKTLKSVSSKGICQSNANEYSFRSSAQTSLSRKERW